MMLNKFSKFGKIYKLDVGDLFTSNGNFFWYSPKNEGKLPFKNYSRVTVSPNKDIVENIENNKYSNIKKLKEVKHSETITVTYWRVEEIDEEDRNAVIVTDKELFCLILNINPYDKDKFEITVLSSVIKKETEKTILTKDSVRYHTLFYKDSMNTIKKEYSEYYITFMDVEFYSEAEDMLMNKAKEDLLSTLNHINNQINRLNDLRKERGLDQ